MQGYGHRKSYCRAQYAWKCLADITRLRLLGVVKTWDKINIVDASRVLKIPFKTCKFALLWLVIDNKIKGNVSHFFWFEVGSIIDPDEETLEKGFREWENRAGGKPEK